MTRAISYSTPDLAIDWTRVGRQWLAVEGHVVDRFLVTFRAPARTLSRLIPDPFTLDVRGDHGFVSVCALEVRNMGISGTPRWLRFHNLEILYRIGVRLRGEPTFLTLRSDTASRALALLGGRFSHYRLRHAEIELERAPERWLMRCTSQDGAADALLDVRADRPSDTDAGSVFRDARDADRFLLGMRFSADRDASGRVLIQPIEHSAWNARFVPAREAEFGLLQRFGARHGVPLVYDSTLAMRDIQQTWLPARVVR